MSIYLLAIVSKLDIVSARYYRSSSASNDQEIDAWVFLSGHISSM